MRGYGSFARVGLRRLALLALLLVLPRTACAAELPTEPEADLPTVLLLGDSISVGYAQLVEEHLAGVADVRYTERENGRPRNLGNTRGALKALRLGWVPEGPFDLIHFNFGQNDFAYRNKTLPPRAPGRLDKEKGAITVPIEAYEANLREIVAALKPRADTLLWASSTVVPEGEPARVPGDEVRYNEVAAKVMRENGVRTHDLHAFTSTFDEDLFVAPGDVHYARGGSEKIAGRVAREIRSVLELAEADSSTRDPDATPR